MTGAIPVRRPDQGTQSPEGFAAPFHPTVTIARRLEVHDVVHDLTTAIAFARSSVRLFVGRTISERSDRRVRSEIRDCHRTSRERRSAFSTSDRSSPFRLPFQPSCSTRRRGAVEDTAELAWHVLIEKDAHETCPAVRCIRFEERRRRSTLDDQAAGLEDRRTKVVAIERGKSSTISSIE